jgi:polyphosphate kinase 2
VPGTGASKIVKGGSVVSRNRSLKKGAANATTSDAAPLQEKMKRKDFEAELRKLQVELVRLQTWAKATGARIIVVFEGRDTAGKGGVISRITQRVSPRVFRHVALPAPTEREKSQLYIQRYVAQFPAAGEIILFDRSWYNRAGVERVMGFCSDEEYERFIRLVPAFEREAVENDIILLKYFLNVSQDEQRRRFADRIEDPIKHWKLSPMDTESVRRWWDYTVAYQEMLRRTDTPVCPWFVVPADDKRRARLSLIAHVLSQIPYKKIKVDLRRVPKAEPKPKGVEEGLPAMNLVPLRY